MSYSVVKINDEPNSPLLKEYILDSASDVATLPTDVADGSSAYVLSFAAKSTLPVHAVSIQTNEGQVIEYKYYKHAQPEPEPESEGE